MSVMNFASLRLPHLAIDIFKIFLEAVSVERGLRER